MWCTQSFAKDDTIGRVRWPLRRWVGGAEGGWALPPFPFTHRWVVSMAQFPTCLATWSPETPRAPEGCRPQTTPTCSAASGPWPRRVSVSWRGSGEQVGAGRGGGRESDAGPAPTVHSSLSSVLAALTAERDQLRGLHQGSEPSRLGVSRGPGGRWEERPEDGRPGQAWGGHRPGPGRGLVEAGPA